MGEVNDRSQIETRLNRIEVDVAKIQGLLEGTLPTLATKAELELMRSGLHGAIHETRSDLLRAVNEQTRWMIAVSGGLVAAVYFIVAHVKP